MNLNTLINLLNSVRDQVGDEPAGMIIRDHNQEIVQDTSKVVPHWIS